jgi:hypothetical protein
MPILTKRQRKPGSHFRAGETDRRLMWNIRNVSQETLRGASICIGDCAMFHKKHCGGVRLCLKLRNFSQETLRECPIVSGILCNVSQETLLLYLNILWSFPFRNAICIMHLLKATKITESPQKSHIRCR